MIKAKHVGIVTVLLLLMGGICHNACAQKSKKRPEATLNEEGKTTIVLTDQQRVAFLGAIHKKLWLLQHFISQIANKSIPVEEREEMADEAIKLFMDENNYIQVYSKTTGKTEQVPIRTYFHRLIHINADRVDITFYEVSQLSELREGNDGYHYGVAYIYQDTKIYKSAELTNPSYYDKTIKKVDTRAKLYRSEIPMDNRLMMEVRFGNIKVNEVRAE